MAAKENLELLGVYRTEEEFVYLVELWINDCPGNIDLSQYTLQEKDRPETDWQVPYDELFLNEDGTQAVGDYFSRKQLSDTSTRVVFFLYVEDFSLPFSTPYGEIALGSPSELPERLAYIVTFYPFD